METVHACDCSACTCSGCPVGCFGATCDQWITSFPDLYTCALLEDAHECDCSLCTCVAALPPPVPPPPPCEDKKGSKWCSKKLSKCSKDTIAAKCELTCGVCGDGAASAPPPPACEDKKGSKWCEKRTKSVKKMKKTCSNTKKAQKCLQTCDCCTSAIYHCTAFWND